MTVFGEKDMTWAYKNIKEKQNELILKPIEENKVFYIV